MQYTIFSDTPENYYDIAILIKPTSFNKEDLEKYYVKYLNQQGISKSRVIAYTLEYFDGKVPAKQGKEYLEELLNILEELKVKYIYCADASYFKLLTKKRKAEPHLGYKIDIPDRDMVCTLGINHSSIIYNSDNLNKLNLSIETFKDIINDSITTLGSNIIHSSDFIYSKSDFRNVLNNLLSYNHLSIDIETRSLQFWEAGLVSISFAWNKHEGVTFWVDNDPIKLNYLKEFFDNYQGTAIYHNANYDVKILIYLLYMKNIDDTKGIINGIKTLTNKIHDTKIIAYLAKNSTARPNYSLKALSHEFAGNYAVEIENIDNYSKEEICKYNLIDTLSTWFVFDTYFPVLEKENLLDLYYGLMLDSMRLLLQIELTGMPVHKNKINEISNQLDSQLIQIKNKIMSSNYVKESIKNIRLDELHKTNSKLKTKQHTIDKFKDLEFNPNSSNHLIDLIYNVLDLPIIDLTPTKIPATGVKTLNKLFNHCKNQEQKELIQLLIDYSGLEKIVSSFIPALQKSIKHESGYFLHGNFNIGGTPSGRLSSSNPNLQNIPSGSVHGKLIKSCFGGHDGQIMCGADFSSLEDRINALLTKDTNKLKVYTDGYDGHSLRAYAYFKKQMPDIDESSVKSINSIQQKYPELRSKSKAPTFALTFRGTHHTLMQNCGFSKQEALEIEENYHSLYSESEEWVNKKLEQACKDGYVNLAFGLKLRTPLLEKSILGTNRTLYQAEAEARTAANAFSGQSYGLLNNRAAIAFMKRVWDSKWKYDIKPISLIHDAIYLVIKDDIECLEWVNENLIEEMQWQDLPEIQHPDVHLEANLEVYFGSWDKPIELSNNANKSQLSREIQQGVKNY